MREIKFRGKRVDTGEWVYGSNIHKVILNDTKEELWVIHPKGEPIEHLGDGYIKYRPPVVITESIGQYIGIKDVFGEEIYEGDIVCCEEYGRWEIKWNEENAQFIADNPNEFEHIEELKDIMTVIGNIHENKELMK